MKYLVLILYTALCFSVSAQQPINTCPEGVYCHNEIMKRLPDYKFDYVDSTQIVGKKVFVFSNPEKEEVQFFYDTYITGADLDLKIKGHKSFKLSSIAAQYLTMYKIYSDFFGGIRSIEYLKKDGEYWTFKNGSIDVSRMSRPEGYWTIKTNFKHAQQ
jgi:hypothetical protein